MSLAEAAIVGSLLLAASMHAGAATLNECKQPDGTTVLLWEKCPGTQAAPPAAAPSKPVSPPAAAASQPKAASKASPSKQGPNAGEGTAPEAAPSSGAPFARPTARQLDREMVVEIISGYTVCADDVEGFRPKYSAAFDFWMLRNSAAVARARTDPATRREIADRIAEGSANGGTGPEKRTYCEKLIGPFLTGKFVGK